MNDRTLAERYRAGASVLALSRETGVSRWSVEHRLRGAGVELRGLAAAAQTRAGRPADALPLYKAAETVGVSRKLLAQAIDQRLVRGTRIARAGTSTRYHVQLDELREDLEKLPRCAAPDCDRAALLPDGMCGSCGGGRRRPRTPTGTVALHRAAASTGVPRRALARAVRLKQVDVERVVGAGTGTRYRFEASAVEVLRLPLCECGKLALRPTGMCGACAFHASIRRGLRDEGLEPITFAAQLLFYTPEGLRAGKVPVERRTFGDVVRLAVNARHILAAVPPGRARQRLAGPLAASLSALKGTVYAPHAVEVRRPGLNAEILELARRGESVRQIAGELSVSKSHVHRVVRGYRDRLSQTLPAVPNP